MTIGAALAVAGAATSDEGFGFGASLLAHTTHPTSIVKNRPTTIATVRRSRFVP